MKRTYAVGLVYGDGVPVIVKRDRTALQAAAVLRRLEATYTRTPPAKIAWDEDDPERGYFSVDDLIEIFEDERGPEWPEYAAAIDAEANGPDLNSEDLHG